MIRSKRHRIIVGIIALLLTTLACGNAAPTSAIPPKPEISVFDSGRTVYGFFPSPPELTTESLLSTLDGIHQHGDVILVQRPVPWEAFIEASDAESQEYTDLVDLLTVASQHNLEYILVIDPLNGLDRRQFASLPAELEGSNFGTPEIRAAFKNYATRLAGDLQPRYLGLASEINTYADAQPADFENFVNLYRETYAAIKAVSPQTQVFVTFQWDDLNNVIPFDIADGEPFQPKWEQIEVFEPQLDLWAISSYPFVVFDSAADIPADYYTPLLTRTDKPLAVAEGGMNSRPIGQFPGTPQDQSDYLNAIHQQIGSRLDFWIYLMLDDINGEAYREFLAQNGMQSTADTILWFAAVGLREMDGAPKPALETWDQIRTE
ncbi:MAG: hypothetical protein HN413_08895 [Chloroflexi bacterium]|jgi:hypothetical protein|nr:hypothetical protein [Chloroflexota bacterium]